MATYLARLIERANGETSPENRVDEIMPVPEAVDAAPGMFDPFEEVIADDVTATPSSELAREAREPLPSPDRPIVPPSRLTPDALEPTVIEGAPLSPPVLDAPPRTETLSIAADSQGGPLERVLVERWLERDEAIIELPPPALVEREVIITPAALEGDNSEDVPSLPVVPAPAAAAISEPPAVMPVPEAPSTVYFVRDEIELDPPAAPPIDGQVRPGNTQPSITIGDVVVEIVTTKRSPESARKTTMSPRRAPETHAPRPGVGSKRRYGIGQT